MGFNICLYRVEDGVARELPYDDWWKTKHTEPTGKWDFVRYGHDRDYYGDLLDRDDEGSHIPILDEDELDEEGEYMWRPSDATLSAIAEKYPDNPRAQLIVNILRSDPSIHVASL